MTPYAQSQHQAALSEGSVQPATTILWLVPRVIGVALGGRGPRSVADAVNGWMHNWESRRILRSMDAYMLRDIGLDETTRRRECMKPFWID